MSIAVLMTIEARKEISPACTTPRRRGGDQCELTTWPCPRYARANFITSQPAAWLSNASVSSTDIQHYERGKIAHSRSSYPMVPGDARNSQAGRLALHRPLE